MVLGGWDYSWQEQGVFRINPENSCEAKERSIAAISTSIHDQDLSTETAKTKETRAIPISDIFKRRELMIFLASVVLFHFANAAMLPMAGQVLAKTHPGADIIALSACIIAAQLVMIVVVATVGWAMRRGIGRKTIFLVALVTLPIRKCLFMLTDSPLGVVAIQLLDGCTGVMAVTPYGLRAVSASWDHTLRLWDLDSGNEIATFIGESHMHSCAIAPDGQTIIAGDVSGRVHFLRLVEVDETKPAIGDTKIQLLLRKEQDARSATES